LVFRLEVVPEQVLLRHHPDEPSDLRRQPPDLIPIAEKPLGEAAGGCDRPSIGRVDARPEDGRVLDGGRLPALIADAACLAAPAARRQAPAIREGLVRRGGTDRTRRARVSPGTGGHVGRAGRPGRGRD
jgi:hypothetical protein